MAYDMNALREAALGGGLPFGYLSRLAAAEDFDPQDPEGNHTLGRQLVVLFDHHVAKCFSSPDPVAALRAAGFTEVADSLTATLAS